MCCAGNAAYCIGPVEDFRDLQNKIDDKANWIQKLPFLTQMQAKAHEWLMQMDDPVKAALNSILEKIQSEEEEVILIINTLFILAYPWDCSGITKRVEEIEDFPEVCKADIRTLLEAIKKCLVLEKPTSPFGRLSKRYAAE